MSLSRLFCYDGESVPQHCFDSAKILRLKKKKNTVVARWEMYFLVSVNMKTLNEFVAYFFPLHFIKRRRLLGCGFLLPTRGRFRKKCKYLGVKKKARGYSLLTCKVSWVVVSVWLVLFT